MLFFFVFHHREEKRLDDNHRVVVRKREREKMNPISSNLKRPREERELDTKKMIRDRKQRTDAKDDAPRSVSRRSSSSRDEDVVVVVSAFRRFCLHHSVTKLKDKE